MQKKKFNQTKFKLKTSFNPSGDQPQAIKKLTRNLKVGVKDQILLGVTGSGKTATMSWVIENIQKPVLIISPNKTLCAQLFQELKDFFPKNSVHYFVSYYDYYQPEAYIPQTNTYIEKDAKINKQIDKLRHAAVQGLMTRNDIILIASVSCIYNIGSPNKYQKVSLKIKTGQKLKRRDLISRIVSLQYQRNNVDFKPGNFRVRGSVIEIFTVTGKRIIRIELDKEKIKEITLITIENENLFNILSQELAIEIRIFPAHFWVTPQEKLSIATGNIQLELQERLKVLKKEKKLIEFQRLKERVGYDLELLKETGMCYGIENYSRHLDFRKPGEAPHSLIDYFPKDFLVFIDESHQALPQIHAMSIQDKIRKQSLIKYGFRLPSALDNRPLTFKEFERKTNQVIYMSATPGKREKEKTLHQPKGKQYIIEQLIRPTGLLEPTIEIRPTKNQVKDLIIEIKKRVKNKQRVLALTLTKRLSEALSDHLVKEGISCQWIHSEIKTLKRPQILNDLRLGKYDVLVGINLLREGLDLPEVALVAILDADKEGFLRSETMFIQTMGRATRNINGHVILYADKTTNSMNKAIKETERRKKIQIKYNKEHHVTPKQIIKKIRDWDFAPKNKVLFSEFWMVHDKKLLEKEMKKAVKGLDFERAAEIRDLIKKLK